MFGQGLKDFIDVLSSLGACLNKVRDLMLFSEFQSISVRDLSFLHFIRHITDEVYDDIGLGMVTNLLKPKLLDVLKAFALRYVVTKEYAVASLVETSRDRLELLLPCRIPDLQFDKFLLVYNHAKVAELSSDRDFFLFKPLCRQSIENAGLTDSCVSYDHNLKEQIILIHYALKVRVILSSLSCRQIADPRMHIRVDLVHFIRFSLIKLLLSQQTLQYDN